MALTKVTGQVIKDTTDVTVGVLTVTNTLAVGGTVSIGGTLTYEDVTNVDAVGLITARGGVFVSAGSSIGIGSATPTADIEVHTSSNTLGILSSTSNGANFDLFDNDTQSRIRTVDGRLHLYADFHGGVSSGNVADSAIRFFVDGSNERLQINSDGDIFTSGDQVRDGARLTITKSATGFTTAIALHNGSGTGSKIISTRSIVLGADYVNNSGADTSYISFETDAAERLRIDSNGIVLANHTAAVGSGKIQSYTSNSDAIDIAAYSTTAANGGRLTFYRSKNATIGSNTEVADNDSLGRIDWRGYNDDGTAYNIGATIEAEVDGAIDSTTDMPSALVFKTSEDGSSTPTERLRIAADGTVTVSDANVSIDKTGTTSSADLSIIGGEGSQAQIQLRADEGDDSADNWRIASMSGFSNRLIFYNGAIGAQTDLISFTTTGAIRVANGTADAPSYTFTDNTDAGLYSNSDNNVYMAIDGTVRQRFNVGYFGPGIDNSYDLGQASFRWDDVRATNGTINTSDRNEKNTITTSDLGLDFVNKLTPVSYKFNDKTRTHYGLIAQDIETVLGTISKSATDFAGFCKDTITEDADGTVLDTPFDRYGLRYTEFISPMIKAIQELSAENTALKARVAALESS